MLTFDSVAPGSRKHAEVKKWLDHAFKDKFVKRDADGKIQDVTTFYDPQLDSHMTDGIDVALVVAWYLLPQSLDLATQLYEAAKQQLGWAAGKATMLPTTGSYTTNLAGLLVAQELGDTKVAKLLRDDLEHFAEPKDFGDGEFGYFFNVGEAWPRGQSSALLVCAEMLTQGQWRAFFQQSPEVHESRLKEPTVEGVDFPYLGISGASNDPDSGILHIETYAATPSHAGRTTKFNVSNLASRQVSVQRDGSPHDKWTFTSATSIAVETEIGDHSFQVNAEKAGSSVPSALSQPAQKHLLHYDSQSKLHLVLRVRDNESDYLQ